ncbi:MAG: peptidoglycan DD-metalloendopeptidase family protein [Eubacterium sp.]|nr:peptidoglycan DD-metalloendopeptidase family protein [Eubacterium sp.]
MFKNKRFFSAILAIVLTFSLVFGSAVSYAEETRESLNNKIENAEEKIEQNKEKAGKISNEMKELSEKIEKTESEIDDLTDEVVTAQKKYAKANAELKKSKEKLEEGNEALQDRLRNIYKSGNLGFVDIILSSGNVSDLFSNIEMMKYIFKNDKAIVADLKEKHKKLEKERAALEVEKANLEEKQQLLESKQDELGDSYALLEDKKEGVESENAKLQKQIAKWQADSAAIQQQINDAQSGGGYVPEVKDEASSSGFLWPVPGYYRVSSEFGWRYLNGYRDYHLGIDIPAPTGTPVVAAKAGRVIATGGQHWSYGNIVIIDHGNGVATAYAHNSSIVVSTGQIVSRGQTIALAGNTGNSYGSHLHFEVRINGTVVNPRSYV